MNWSETLTQKERDDLFGLINDGQKTFLTDLLKRGRRTAFANVLAKEKASSAEDNNIEAVAQQWDLQDYLDAGPEWQTNPQLFCECKRPLRYQYIVQNLKTGEVKKFGIKHFEEHTGIPSHLVNEIVKGIERIDFELDEVLLKISRCWSLKDEGIYEIPKSVEIPDDIQQHLKFNIPLLDRQVRRLRERIISFQRVEEEIRLKKLRLERVRMEREKKENLVKLRQEVASTKDFGKHLKKNIPLEDNLQYGVLVFLNMLKKTLFSAIEVCEDLIKNHDGLGETYISGKFKIYPNVCMFLKYLEQHGSIELVEKQGTDNLVYKLKDRGFNDYLEEDEDALS
jgi:hypothetical protein